MRGIKSAYKVFGGPGLEPISVELCGVLSTVGKNGCALRTSTETAFIRGVNTTAQGDFLNPRMKVHLVQLEVL